MAQFFPGIISVCKNLLQWDPNYDYDEFDDMEEDEDEEMDEDLMVCLRR